MDVSGGDEHRALHFAVLLRDVPMVRLLMEAGADARKGIFPHRDATSALVLAKDRNYTEIVEVIEEEERRRREEMSCPNATISPIQDQVSLAIRKGETAVAIRLLDADRSLIQACDRTGGTPLHLAAQEGNVELVHWLLDRRASVRKEDIRGFTALDRAALSGEHEYFNVVARELLQHGAVITIRAAVAMPDEHQVCELLQADPSLLRQIDNNGGLLTIAVRHGNAGMVKLLLDLGADVDERILLADLEEPTPSWGMPLWHAARENRPEIARLLLDRGADPNANVYASGWPLGHAWSHEDASVKNLLLERGAKLQPYMVSETHNVAEAQRLLNSNPSENVIHELLWSAADHGCPEIVERSLHYVKWAPDDPRWHWVMIQPVRGASAVSANNEGHLQCLAILLNHGVNANVSRFGQTVLHFAAAYHGPVRGGDRARFAALLLDHGAKLDLRDELLESTPLGWACRWGREELVELLLGRGALADEPDAKPWASPKAWAKHMGHDAVLARLRYSQP